MKGVDAGLVVVLVAVFAASALLSLVLTPLVRRLARRFDVVDQPGARRVHSSPIPRGRSSTEVMSVSTSAPSRGLGPMTR